MNHHFLKLTYQRINKTTIDSLKECIFKLLSSDTKAVPYLMSISIKSSLQNNSPSNKKMTILLAKDDLENHLSEIEDRVLVVDKI